MPTVAGITGAGATGAGAAGAAGATGAGAGATGVTLLGQSAMVTVFGVPVVAILLEQVNLGVAL